MSLRQLGFALNLYDGPLSIFLTTNFADMYSPITAVLMNGAGEPLGKREVNLLDNEPHMPTLQAMHRALAKHPMLQVDLFLLLDDLVHTELYEMDAFIGMGMLQSGLDEPPWLSSNLSWLPCQLCVISCPPSPASSLVPASLRRPCAST